MYKKPLYHKTLITASKSFEGETIEMKVKRLVENKEPIKDGSPLIYTDRKEGVKAAYNIRTDRFEIATDAMDKVHKSKQAKRDALIKKEKEDAKIVDINKNDGKAEPADGKAKSK